MARRIIARSRRATKLNLSFKSVGIGGSESIVYTRGSVLGLFKVSRYTKRNLGAVN